MNNVFLSVTRSAYINLWHIWRVCTLRAVPSLMSDGALTTVFFLTVCYLASVARYAGYFSMEYMDSMPWIQQVAFWVSLHSIFIVSVTVWFSLRLTSLVLAAYSGVDAAIALAAIAGLPDDLIISEHTMYLKAIPMAFAVLAYSRWMKTTSNNR